MIVGIGFDLVALPRFAALLERHRERALRRLFTEDEARYCLSRVDPIPSFGARFAAKEALFKALGTGYQAAGGWRSVEVLRDPAGAPALRLHGPTQARFREHGATHAHLSLSHTAEHAAAFVVLERR
jgi:holo-[acyl-carrier protein] synthase